jgi:PTH1 family peptidyl-tRNA hydrolase
MHLIVGLGNPGKEYDGTRHNVGWELLDRLAGAHQIKIDQKVAGVRAQVGRGTIAGEKVMLVRPLTYMNLSGEAVLPLVHRELAEEGEDGKSVVALARLLVVCDDIHLPVGKLRLRPKGSSGGQNGLKNIALRLGTQDFSRLRIGVGEPPPGLQVDWVLGKFGRADRAAMDDTLIVAMGAAEVWLSQGIEAAMNRFNGDGAAGSDR